MVAFVSDLLIKLIYDTTATRLTQEDTDDMKTQLILSEMRRMKSSNIWIGVRKEGDIVNHFGMTSFSRCMINQLELKDCTKNVSSKLKSEI